MHSEVIECIQNQDSFVERCLFYSKAHLSEVSLHVNLKGSERQTYSRISSVDGHTVGAGVYEEGADHVGRRQERRLRDSGRWTVFISKQQTT